MTDLLDVYADARTHLGALIDDSPDDLVGAYATVLDELDELCGHLPLATASPGFGLSRSAHYAAARTAVDSVARTQANRLGYELCLARLDAAWETERARSLR